LDEVPAAGTEKHLLVVAKAVEKIEDGVAAELIGVEAGRKKNAVRDGPMKDFAGERIAFGAADGGSRRRKEVKKAEEAEEGTARASGE
jgi:hypothetical protein